MKMEKVLFIKSVFITLIDWKGCVGNWVRKNIY